MKDTTKKKAFIILSIGFFLIGSLVYVLHDTSSSFRLADRDFSIPSDQEIVRIEMRSADGSETVVMEKDDQGRWALNQTMFANDLAIRDLSAALSRLRVRQPVSLANQAKVEELLENEGVLVNVSVNSYRIIIGNLKLFPYRNRVLSMIVGADTPGNDATYMQKTRSSQAFKVHRTGFERGIASLFIPRERIWRNPVVFDFQSHEIDRVEVLLPDKMHESFAIEIDNGKEFTVFTGTDFEVPLNSEVLDTLRVLRFIDSFRDIYYETLLDEEAEALREELIADHPMMIVRVISPDRPPVEVIAFERRPVPGDPAMTTTSARDPNRFYVQLENGEFALAQFYVFNRILRPLSFFKNKRP